MPLLGWRAVSKLSVDRETQSLGTEWNAIPDDNGWRWFGSGLLKSETSGSYEVDSGRLRGGRSKAGDHIDRSYFLQYDYAQNRGIDAPPSASAVSANWSWTGRYFDDAGAPTRGQGLALELGSGYTLTGERLPFTRVNARWLGIVPLGTIASDDGTQARTQPPAVARRRRRGVRQGQRADPGHAAVPDRRRHHRARLQLSPDRHRARPTARSSPAATSAVASVEWQRPVVYNGKLTDSESVVFVDAGAVADKPGDLEAKVGVGVGARWRSPVGPVQADVAYGVETQEVAAAPAPGLHVLR